MSLTDSQKKYLRGQGHDLKPVLTVGGAGVTDGVLREFSATIDHHELIKVRVRAGDRESRDRLIAQLVDAGEAELITRIGNVALVYRRNEDEPRLRLPG